MHRSRLFSILSAGLLATLHFIATAAYVFAEPIRRMWPEAFPTASPTPRELAPVAAVDRDHTVASRMTAYALRRSARTRHDMRAAPGLILAV